jgi:hypothetical protein
MNDGSLRENLSRYGALAFSLVHLIAASGILYSTWYPSYRGGMFLQALLIGVAGLSSVVMFSEVFKLYRMQDRQEKSDSNSITIVLFVIITVLVTITTVGIYLGSAILLLIYWLIAVKITSIRAITLAITFGIIMPFMFSYFMERRLWPGIVPTIIPQYLGGGIIPPI